MRSMRSENEKRTCESHEYIVADEIICQYGKHYCRWCGDFLGTCDCFAGANLAVIEEDIVKGYLISVEEILERKLRPTEKQAVIQQFLNLKKERI